MEAHDGEISYGRPQIHESSSGRIEFVRRPPSYLARIPFCRTSRTFSTQHVPVGIHPDERFRGRSSMSRAIRYIRRQRKRKTKLTRSISRPSLPRTGIVQPKRRNPLPSLTLPLLQAHRTYESMYRSLAMYRENKKTRLIHPPY